ncbi:Pkinase-domain-containing protein [Nadsonia fulvescens var. elongata DSM 6958]|uniref:non-specific serine/threonine protein kinase n=1 Tax=Nadsonia fulvescens var. elongata DSM 6958 TaxID=857566 RepID=A0A1E3PL28_9ASCO|nr:Pkinase-domain-containing protein [Nadsonia fulvescens var. elongata DSM 6958]
MGFSLHSSSGSSSPKTHPSSSSSSSGSTMSMISDKLHKLSFKQNRLLGHGTHTYERFPLNDDHHHPSSKNSNPASQAHANASRAHRSQQSSSGSRSRSTSAKGFNSKPTETKPASQSSASSSALSSSTATASSSHPVISPHLAPGNASIANPTGANTVTSSLSPAAAAIPVSPTAPPTNNTNFVDSASTGRPSSVFLAALEPHSVTSPTKNNFNNDHTNEISIPCTTQTNIGSNNQGHSNNNSLQSSTNSSSGSLNIVVPPNPATDINVVRETQSITSSAPSMTTSITASTAASIPCTQSDMSPNLGYNYNRVVSYTSSRDGSPIRSPEDDPFDRKYHSPTPKDFDSAAARYVFNRQNSNSSIASITTVNGHGHNNNHSNNHAGVLSSSSAQSASNGPYGAHSLLGPSGNKHSSSFLSINRHKSTDSDHDGVSGKFHKSHGSMMELKRFFKGGSSKKDKSVKKDKAKHSGSDSKTREPSKLNKSSICPSLSSSSSSASLGHGMPFCEEGFKKYGKIGKVLGSGAGGSVRLMKRTSDGVTFAVKEFRPRHAHESERDYAKKVTAEFCIGSTLHHPNVIETLDIIQEGSKFYEVMEYCPYDFFAIVMSGKMSRNEIACTFKQIINGITYLHDMGLAHRDIKLDNCVVTSDGIIKLIDFGSASVFRYPFEEDVVLAHGVVGSDPYLAPEVLSASRYDPQPADIWSIAIVFCCIALRRFPWKAPKLSDNSYKLFASLPNYPVNNPLAISSANNTTPTTNSAPTNDSTSVKDSVPANDPTSTSNSTPASDSTPVGEANPASIIPSTTAVMVVPTQHTPTKAIKGPYRLLRLLPHESRPLIGKMLEINPRRRATIADIWNDPWFQSISMCTTDKHGVLIKGEGHEHTFVGDNEAHLESYKPVENK